MRPNTFLPMQCATGVPPATCGLCLVTKLAIGHAKKMRGNTMSPVTNYKLNHAATVGPSFIAS
jgi:hypothetical protein